MFEFASAGAFGAAVLGDLFLQGGEFFDDVFVRRDFCRVGSGFFGGHGGVVKDEGDAGGGGEGDESGAENGAGGGVRFHRTNEVTVLEGDWRLGAAEGGGAL